MCMVAGSAQPMRDEAKKLLAWQSIYDEAHEWKLDDAQRAQVKQHVDRALRDLQAATCLRVVPWMRWSGTVSSHRAKKRFSSEREPNRWPLSAFLRT